MKNLYSHTLAIFMIIIMIFTFSSCSSTSENSRYAYLFYEKDLTLMKIDVNTGKATTVCSDSLCNHSSTKCPFYKPVGVGNRFTITEDNKNIIYIAGGENNTYCLREYSLVTGSVKELFSSSNVIKSMLLIKNYLFFTEQLVQFKDGTISSTCTDIYKVDVLSNNKVTKLTSEPEKNTVMPDFMVGDKLLWEIFESSEYYTTNLDYTDKISINRSSIQKEYNGDYNYKLSYTQNKEKPNLTKVSITKINKKTKKEDVILTGVKDFRICDNYILYTRSLDNAELIGKKVKDESALSDEQETFYNYCDRKLYSCNLDGTNEKVVCDLDPGYYIFSASSTIGYTKYYGDYHLIDLYKYEFNSAGEITNILTEEHMVVNVKTGEYHIVKE